MKDMEMIGELSLRANVPETSSRAVLSALRELVQEGRLREDVLGWSWNTVRSAAPADPADPAAVAELIAAARRHPLGVDFLRRGFLGSVAAEFRAHAFTVEAARERLAAEAPDRGDMETGVVECL